MSMLGETADGIRERLSWMAPAIASDSFSVAACGGLEAAEKQGLTNDAKPSLDV